MRKIKPTDTYWATMWLHNVYGLGEDDCLSAGKVEECVQMAVWDALVEFSVEHNIGIYKGIGKK